MDREIERACMDNLKEMHEMCDTLCGEVKEMNSKVRAAGGKMYSQDLETIDRLTHALKSIKTAIAMEEAEEDDYYRGGRYSRRR